MTAKLNFPDTESAKKLRDKYFLKYHSTAKALSVAESEGKLPLPQGWPKGKKFFDPNDLSDWWAEHLNFDLLGEKDSNLIEMLESCPLNMVAFSNGPRKYVLRVLREMGLDHVFPENRVFTVNDTLPACKPEKEAFEKVFDAVGVKDPSECIMVEDSMKNIRAAKSLGMYTVLIAGIGRLKRNETNLDGNDEISNHLANAAEATKAGDAPDHSDPSVDICIEQIKELKSVLPGLWKCKSSS